MPESLLNKVAGLKPGTLLKKRLCHRCFPVNLAKLLKHLFFRPPPVAASKVSGFTMKAIVSHIFF